MLTTDVENYPGFPEGIMGPDLMLRFREQAERFGTEFVTADADRVDLSGPPFTVDVGGTEHRARALIISTGASAQMLGLPNEQRLLGHGVSTCATCDGFFFRDQHIGVVGGGDTAIEEALFLTKFASQGHGRAPARRAARVEDHAGPRVREPEDRVPRGTPSSRTSSATRSSRARRLRNVVTGDESELPRDRPVRRDRPHRRTPTSSRASSRWTRTATSSRAGDSTRTSVEGVFAAGDVQDHVYRQAITAAGTGCMAAIETERWLAEAAHAAGSH